MHTYPKAWPMAACIAVSGAALAQTGGGNGNGGMGSGNASTNTPGANASGDTKGQVELDRCKGRHAGITAADGTSLSCTSPR